MSSAELWQPSGAEETKIEVLGPPAQKAFGKFPSFCSRPQQNYAQRRKVKRKLKSIHNNLNPYLNQSSSPGGSDLPTQSEAMLNPNPGK